MFALLACSLSATTKPHIVYLLVDDLGYANVGYNSKTHGPTDPMTPNIDNLFTDGVELASEYRALRAAVPTFPCPHPRRQPLPRPNRLLHLQVLLPNAIRLHERQVAVSCQFSKPPARVACRRCTAWHDDAR